MKRNYFNRKKRQFRRLSEYINRLIATHEWERKSIGYKTALIARLNFLFRQVCQYFSRPELRKILAAAAIFIGLPMISNSQSFAPPQLNPFGLTPDSVYAARPAFADIDNDADLDLFTGVYEYDSIATIRFYKNTGTPDSPNFEPPVENPFGIVLSSGIIAFPAFADIDNDEDPDLFLCVNNEDNYFLQFLFYENTGTPAEPQFAAAEINPFGLNGGFGFAIPEFADIDNDGDLDLFTGEYNGIIKFYENTGNASEPDFAVPVQNPFGITSVYNIASPAFSDIDHDGDLDLFAGEYYGNFQYFRNSGTIEEPAFATPIENPFGLVSTYNFNFPAIADLDDDGDADILVGEYYGMFQYFTNTEINIGITENSGEDVFDLFPNPAKDQVFIRIKDRMPGQFAEVSIADLNGRIVKSSILNPNDQRLTTNDLQPGVYFVKVAEGEKVFTKKLIIR
jgi:hypothetical protein